MSDVVVKAGSLVLIIALGYAIKRAGWVQAGDFAVFSKVVLRITLPCALLVAFQQYEVRPSMLALTLAGFVIIATGLVVGALVDNRRGPRAQAFALLNVSNINIGLFAMPYLATFVGPQALLVAAMFDVGNALAAAGLGYAWGMGLARPETRAGAAGVARRLLSSPVFVTYLALLLLGLARIRMPAPVMTFAGTVGAANTFLAMLMIGIGLEVVLDRRKYATAVRYLVTRWAVMLAAGLAVWFLVPFSPADKLVVCMLLAGPMAAMAPGFTDEAGLDVEVSTFMTSVTALVAIAAMPAVLAILS